MRSVLAPVSATAYKNGHQDRYGVVELDATSGDVVWAFDATASEFTTSRLYQSGDVVKRTGFRPASVERLDDGRTLVADWARGVFVDEDGDVEETFTHELFNDVHEIQRTDGGLYLVASTGMDSLFVLDEDFEELWRWHMWEHVDPPHPGHYYPDQLWYRDVRDLALNPDDRYHLNYATVLEGRPAAGDATILCSALNYGVFTVDMATGEITRAQTGLDECHNPYRLGDGDPTAEAAQFVVPESGADRVVRTDWEGTVEPVFEGELAFVKDADPVGDGEWLVTDTKHDRVVLWTEGDAEPHRTFDLGEDANPYEADALAGDDSFA